MKNMIEEDYVSFETAKLLKEKGFDCKKESITAMYNEDGEFYSLSSADPYYYYYDDFDENDYICPTLQMAMKWLREVHKVEVRVSYDIEKTSWWGGCNPMYEEDEENSNMFQSLLGFDYQGKTYEEACEAAIRYCLQNFI